MMKTIKQALFMLGAMMVTLGVITIMSSLVPVQINAQRFANPQPFYNPPFVMWDDLQVPINTLGSGAAPADPGTWGASGNLRVLRFGVNEDADGVLQLPHSYKLGTDLYPHVHWGPVSTASGNVKWCWDYSWIQDGEATGAPTSAQCAADVAAGGTAFANKYTALPTIDGHTSPKTSMSSILVFRVYRGAADTSEYGADVALLEFDVHIQKDSIGSMNMTSK